MPEQQLRKNIAELRKEIARMDDSQTAEKDRLNLLINDIEANIDTDDDADDDALISYVKDAISHFETEHPRATAILNDIMVTLSNMGI